VEREGLQIRDDDLAAVAGAILCRRHAAFDAERDVIVADAKGFGGTNAAVLLRAER